MRRIALLAVLSWGCTDSVPARQADASVADAGFVNVVDAGSTADSGVIADAGASADAGTSADAGAVADAGESVDAGAALDAGAVPDAGTVPDSGVDPCVFGSGASLTLHPRAAVSSGRLEELLLCATNRPAEAQAFASGFLEEVAVSGGHPPVGPSSAFILFDGDATDYSVSLSSDGWPGPGIRGFAQVPNSTLNYAEVPLSTNERKQYKLTHAPGGVVSEWITDPINRWVVWDGIDQQDVGDFNNELFGAGHVPTSSALHRFFIVDRNVYLQIPADYLNAPSPLGVLYVNDGNESLTRGGGFQAVADATFAANRADPTFIAYVALANQNDRINEYTYGPGTGGTGYVTYLVDQVIPAIEPNLMTKTMPDNRGITGVSLGGLISFHAASTRSDVFRLLGSQSASLWYDNDEMVTRFTNDPTLPLTIYIDCGTDEGNYAINQAMADVLTNKGYPHLANFVPGLHEWGYWNDRFDELLEFLY